ncbi:DUF4436 family protein [Fluviispira sanaruensis]|uniref:DUF4436 domain-containing protein n=1 Tax=Fluviispira sanaruensis TaxID=2493639 RepID=A0A4P2VTD6_FLUSA|nr:DUF4436 family protein [Fluviispira sanaruensis]BBH52635.1 hypothetical protein JCM31447_10760 [Fluviispira sanaruensis]
MFYSYKNLYMKLCLLLFLTVTLLGQSRAVKSLNLDNDTLPILQINMLSFDDVNAVLTAKSQIFFPPKLISTNGTLQNEYNFVDVLNFGESILNIKANKRYAAFNNGLNANYQLDNIVEHFYYPFDKYKIKLLFFLDRVNANGTIENIPFKYNCDFCSVRGYNIITRDLSKPNQNFLTLETYIERPLSTRIISMINIISMWVLALVVVFMTYSIAKSQMKPEIGTFGFIAGLLFTLPLIRNISPMIPYMGVFIDFIGFFINEFIIALCMVFTAYYWMIRNKLEAT